MNIHVVVFKPVDFLSGSVTLSTSVPFLGAPKPSIIIKLVFLLYVFQLLNTDGSNNNNGPKLCEIACFKNTIHPAKAIGSAEA